jgi:chromosome segregation ATPase
MLQFSAFPTDFATAGELRDRFIVYMLESAVGYETMASDETLRQNEGTNLILQAIAEFQGEVRREIGEIRQEIRGIRQEIGEIRQEIGDLRRQMNERFSKVEAEIEEIKQSQFSFDVRLDRVQAMAHDALNIGHDLKADVKVLTAELRAWAADVVGLQQQHPISLKK